MRATVPTPATHPKSETRPNSQPVFVLGAGANGLYLRHREEIRLVIPPLIRRDIYCGTTRWYITAGISSAARSRHVLTVPVKRLRTLPSVPIPRGP